MAQDLSLDEYFLLLRSNLVYAELSLMQLVKVANLLENRSSLEDDLRVNLEIQERALKDMLVLGVARLFDKKKRHADQISVPNLKGNSKIHLTQYHEQEIRRLQSLQVVTIISSIRDRIVAHSLSHAQDETFQAVDVMQLIDKCYQLISDIYNHNKPEEKLERRDISLFSVKWSEMTKYWR